MAHSIHAAKAYLAAHSKQLAEALVSMVNNPQTPASVKLKAIEMALDRIGLPALRASITQNVGTMVDLRSLQDTKSELIERQKELAEKMEQLSPTQIRKNEREFENARKTADVLPYTEGPLPEIHQPEAQTWEKPKEGQ